MATFQSNTPSKSYFRIQYTPTTKKRICILCGKREENDSYRVRLFKSEKKSEACELVEKLLSIEISPVLHTDSICRNCHKSLLTLKTKLIYHKTNYEKTIQNLKHTHGKTSKKRLPFEEPDSTHEAKESRRESSNPLPLCESMVEDKNEKKNSKVSMSYCIIIIFFLIEPNSEITLSRSSNHSHQRDQVMVMFIPTLIAEGLQECYSSVLAHSLRNKA